jgi:hypothetical protein
MRGMAGQGAALTLPVRGMASFSPSGSGAADPLDPARTVRRALADARKKAFDVVGLIVSAELAPTTAAAGEFARRALGPHGESVIVESVPADRVIGRAIRGAGDTEGVVLALVYAEPVVVALCLQADSRGRGGPSR